MQDDMIPLDPEKGLDPHLTYCPRCGGEANELTIGAVRKAKLPNGQWVYASRNRLHEVRKELEKQYGYLNLKWEPLDEYEKVPASDVCDKCKEELATFDDVIKSGGVYFKCKECGATGVIKYNDGTKEFCDAVRKTAGVPFGRPVGVELEKCEEHGGKAGNE